jgi:hypothetical protein
MNKKTIKKSVFRAGSENFVEFIYRAERQSCWRMQNINKTKIARNLKGDQIMFKNKQTRNNFVRMLVALKEDILLHRAALIIVAAFLLAGISSAKGDTITVGPPIGRHDFAVAHYDFPAIQAGIDAAVDGDTVLVAPGEYVITEPVTFRGKAITVKSEAGPDETTIRLGTPTNTDRASVVIFENNETDASVLDGFTITGGTGSWVSSVSAYAGGGIYFDASSGTLRNCAVVNNGADVGGGGGVSACFGSSPILTNCIFTGNSATWGGGVHCWDSSSPTLTNCIVVENSAGDVGGGVYSGSSSSAVMTGCTIAGNSAKNGAGIWCGINSSVTVTNCTIRGNSAIGSTPRVSGYGGGAECWNNSSMVMNDCTIAENSAGQSGGAVFCETSSVTLTNCRVVNNTTNGVGGGMECVSAPVTLTNCLIARNTAARGAGGLASGYAGSSLNVKNCTIWGNSATEPGGGIKCWQGSTEIANSIIWLNIAPQGRQISVENAGTLGLTYCNIAGGQAGVNVASGCVLDWGEDNIDVDPCFADPENDDYHLKSQAGRWDTDTQTWIQDDVTSPCIDAGDPMSPIGLEPFPNGGFVNMGAFGGTPEASKSYFGELVCETIIAGDINGDGQVNRADLEIMALHWTDEEPLKAN